MNYNITMIITLKEFDAAAAHKDNESFSIEVDFGQRIAPVKREGHWIIIDGRYRISLKTRVKQGFAYLLKESTLVPIAFFSDDTNRFYKLLPTQDWPTVTIGSVPMHKISGISPKQDTYNKVSLIKPYGLVLDTCMGMGYTAILAAASSKMVYTFEADENVYFIAELNPFSQRLFESKNIKITKGDVSMGIKEFGDNLFDCIIHDPPTFKISPVLYSLGFYKEVHRVLKQRGRFFHYTPFYGVKRGVDFPSKIKTKLKESGFKIVKFEPSKGGVICRK